MRKIFTALFFTPVQEIVLNGAAKDTVLHEKELLIVAETGKVLKSVNVDNISLYTRSAKSKIAELQGQKSTLNTILFKDENAVTVWQLS